MASSSSAWGTAADDRVQFETLITDLSALLMAQGPDQVDAEIAAALDRVRTFFDADRCGLLTFGVSPSRSFVQYASYGPGVSLVAGDFNLAEAFPWAYRTLLEQKPVIVYRLSDLPAEAATDRASWEQTATRSNLTLPVAVGSCLLHAIAMNWVHQEHRFPDAYVPRLRVLGEVILSAVQRKEAFQALRTTQERLDRAAAAAGCGLWELDVSTGQIWVTSETRRLYGMTAEEDGTWERFVGLLHPDDRDRIVAMVATVIHEDGQFDERYRVVRDDGAERWMHVVARKGSPTRLLGASVDETDRVEAEHRTALQVARVAAAVDVAEVGFSEWTVGGGPPYVDTRLRGLLGLENEAGEAIQQRWLSRTHPDDRKEVDERRRRLLAGEIDHLAVEYRYAHPGRGEIWVRHVSRRDVVPGSGAVHVVGAVQDITERRQHEEELQRALDEVRRLRDRVEQENVYLRHEARRREGQALVVGRSQAIRHALSLVEQVAPTDSTVLLLGETGCGKERFATLLHGASRRSDRTMIRVNCAAIPVALIESELFGREKGAFTGAASRQLGRFELAHGSTLFLDEVGDLPAETQVKLLRVLEEHTIERLGSAKPVRVDVRIIAATHRDLRRAVAQGTFREDLYYRLNVFPLAVPSLRERREDIPLLVSAFVDEFAASMGKRINAIDPSTMEALSEHAWPGNIRELRNVVERAMIMATSPVLRVDHSLLEPALESIPAPSGDAERTRLLGVLQEAGWRVRGEHGAAARLGLKPTTLEARMRRLGITRPGLVLLLASLQSLAGPPIAPLL